MPCRKRSCRIRLLCGGAVPHPRQGGGRRRSIGYVIVKYIVFVIFIFYAVSLAFPFLWMLLNSFKTTGDFVGGNIFGFPAAWTFENFSYVLGYTINGTAVWQMFVNSVLLTVAGTAVNVFFSTLAAYCVAKYRFPGRSILYGVAVITMVVPIVGTMPGAGAHARNVRHDGFLLRRSDSCIRVHSGFNFILLHGSFSNISWSYAEAAQIDGANQAQIMFRVMLPIGHRTDRRRRHFAGDRHLERLFHAVSVHAFNADSFRRAAGSAVCVHIGNGGGNFPGIFATVHHHGAPDAHSLRLLPKKDHGKYRGGRAERLSGRSFYGGLFQ